MSRRPRLSRLFTLTVTALVVAAPSLSARAESMIPEAATDSAASAVIKHARGELRTPLYSVTDKTQRPASGDPHDYFSFAPYWWPDPTRPDGLPYERRDGEYNEATLGSATDKQRLIDFVDTVNALAWAFEETRDERYAERAVDQLRHWFIHPQTRMAPNLRYAQAIPGRVDGRGIGIIESRLLTGLAASIERLDESPVMDSDTRDGLTQWYADYLDWLLTSGNGRDERAKENNHGTWYDAQVVAFANFVGRPSLARQHLQSALERLTVQIAPDGSQPLELERTRPWHYVNFNLQAWSTLLRESSRLDLRWPEKEADRERLAAAYRWIADHASHPADWPYSELHGFHPQTALPNLVAATRHHLLPDDSRARTLIDEWSRSLAPGTNPDEVLSLAATPP